MGAHDVYALKGWWPWSRDVEAPSDAEVQDAPQADPVLAAETLDDACAASPVYQEIVAAAAELDRRIEQAREAGGTARQGAAALRRERQDLAAQLADLQKQIASIDEQLGEDQPSEIDKTLEDLMHERERMGARLNNLRTAIAKRRQVNGRSAA